MSDGASNVLEAVRLWGVLGARAAECRRLGLLDERAVEQLQTGDLVSVRWSGGNGPHTYIVHRSMFGQVGVMCARAFAGYMRDPEVARGSGKMLLDHIGPRPLTEVRRVEGFT